MNRALPLFALALSLDPSGGRSVSGAVGHDEDAGPHLH